MTKPDTPRTGGAMRHRPMYTTIGLAFLAALILASGALAHSGDGDPNDLDHDGLPNTTDNCPDVYNPRQDDTDQDDEGDACDLDDDDDGLPDTDDNCPKIVNVGQEDWDDDGVGDPCDNCRCMWNPNQQDTDSDRAGDNCDVAWLVPAGLCTSADGIAFQEDVVCPAPGIAEVCL